MTVTKVLFILPWLHTGGSERYVTNLCKYLDRKEFEVQVVYRGDWGPIGDELKGSGIKLTHNPMKVHRPDQLFRFYRQLQREEVDIVHSLNYRPNFTDALMTRLAGKKFVSSRRNVRFWKGSERLHWGEKVRNDRTDLVIVNAQRLKDGVVSFEHVPADKVLVIYNGVPSKEAEAALASEGWERVREELDIPLGAVVIGNMANLRPTKGQSYLLQAFRKVLESTELPVYLVITGQGEEEEALRKQITSLGMADHAMIHKTAENRFNVIRAYDIFVLSSLQEGFSNALVEAMALGKACVVTDVGGNTEAVTDGITGLIVPPKDPEALANALTELVKDPDRRRIMGHSGMVKAHHEFDLERMIKEHQAAYHMLMGERK